MQTADKRAEHYLFSATVVGLFILGWYLQASLFLNWDVSWLMYAADKLLAGGSYVTDFFETNPPLILYLYLPPLLVSKLFGLSIILVFRVYLFLLIAFSLSLCWYFIKNIIQKEDRVLGLAFFYVLAATFLILPLLEFGQREHLLTILTMPYILCVIGRLRGAEVKPALALLIGVLAALGFGLKPYFISTMVFLELYLAYSKRWLLAWLRPETVTIILLLFIYGVSIYLFYPDYLNVIVPYALRNYYVGLGKPWQALILSAPTLLVMLLLAFSLFESFLKKYHHFKNVLTLTLLSYLLFVYMIQRTYFYYHLLPLWSLVFILSTVFVVAMATKAKEAKETKETKKVKFVKRDDIIITIFSALLVLFMMWQCNHIWITIIFNPIAFYIFFAFIIGIMLFLSAEQISIVKVLYLDAIIVGISALFSHYIYFVSSHVFSYTLLMMWLLFCFSCFFGRFIPGATQDKLKYSSIAIIFTLLTAYPAFTFLNQYNSATTISKPRIELITQFVNQYAKNQPIYFFSTTMVYTFPMINYAQTSYASRFPFFWMLPGLLTKAKYDTNAIIQRDKDFLIKLISEDLNKNKPYLIFVDANKFKVNLGHIQYNYLDDFLKNSHFEKAWKNYQFLTTLSVKRPFPFERYDFNIYQRIDHAASFAN